MTDSSTALHRQASTRADHLIEQHWDAYTPAEHATWRALFERQTAILSTRAAPEFLSALDVLGYEADRLPDFRRLNERLDKATGWQVVAVPGLAPDDVFFRHLAERRFPSTCFIRRPEEMDYLEEPDIFHDVFGHVPMLANPVFGDYMQAFGEGGLKAIRLGTLGRLSRLYWYTVEFGLIKSNDGLKIYGSGIASSKTESLHCLDSPVPHRIGFDRDRIMRTTYRIDDLQSNYFVIDSFDQLFDATRPDFTPIYQRLAGEADIPWGATVPGDVVIHRGHPPVHPDPA